MTKNLSVRVFENEFCPWTLSLTIVQLQKYFNVKCHRQRYYTKNVSKADLKKMGLINQQM